MVKLLIAIIVGLILTALSVSHFTSSSSANVGGSTTSVGSPSDAINGAKNAVEQTQNLQDTLKSKATSQYNQ